MSDVNINVVIVEHCRVIGILRIQDAGVQRQYDKNGG